MNRYIRKNGRLENLSVQNKSSNGISLHISSFASIHDRARFSEIFSILSMVLKKYRYIEFSPWDVTKRLKLHPNK